MTLNQKFVTLRPAFILIGEKTPFMFNLLTGHTIIPQPVGEYLLAVTGLVSNRSTVMRQKLCCKCFSHLQVAVITHRLYEFVGKQTEAVSVQCEIFAF